MKESKDIQKKPKKLRRAVSVEAREDQMIDLALGLAEAKLLDGTASSQIIVHYLKLGSTKERLEKEILAEQKKLISAKTEVLESAKRVEELYSEAISAMRIYSGNGNDEDEDV